MRPSTLLPARLRTAALTVALLLTASAAMAQTDDLSRVRAEFGEVQAARISDIIDGGVRDGLPRSLLVEKAVEGVAKGMAPEIVLEALTHFAKELRAAAAVVGSAADPATLERAANALRRGVDRSVLADLHREGPEEFPITVIALEDLLDLGVSPRVAADMVRDATARGFNSDELLGLPASVERLVREGSTPLQAASSVHAGVRSRRGVVPPFPGRPGSALPTRSGRRIPPIP